MKNLITLISMLAISLNCFADVIEVPGDYPTIMQGINAAQTGDTVLIMPGTYQEQVSFNGKGIVIGSLFLTTGDTSYISQTIIMPPVQGGAVVLFENFESNASVLCGVKLMNGTGKQVDIFYRGGAVYCADADPILDHLWVTQNSCGGFNGQGGGIYFINSEAVVNNCRIDSNESSLGGGICAILSAVSILNSHITDNFSLIGGGGIYYSECDLSLLQKCLFTGNISINGGAISCSASHALLDRVTCYRNNGHYGGSLNLEFSASARVINSILWDNSADPSLYNEIHMDFGYNEVLIAYSDVMGTDTAINLIGEGEIFWEEGNISVDPMFNDTAALDLTLRWNSPCVDVGTTCFVYYGDTLVSISSFLGHGPDMGAYESSWTLSTDPKMNNGTADIVIEEVQGMKVIRLNPEKPCHIEVVVYDMMGRQVERLFDGNISGGATSINWDVTGYRRGCYILTMNEGGRQVAKKVVVTW